MSNPASTPEISQADVDSLLGQLRELYSLIAAIREEITPIEADLSRVYEEFQAVVGGLRRQSMRLQAEIVNLRVQIEHLIQEEDDAIEENDAEKELRG